MRSQPIWIRHDCFHLISNVDSTRPIQTISAYFSLMLFVTKELEKCTAGRPLPPSKHILVFAQPSSRQREGNDDSGIQEMASLPFILAAHKHINLECLMMVKTAAAVFLS